MSIEILQADCKRALNALVGNYDMSNTELDEIVNNDEKIEELISGMDESYLKEVENEKERLLASNNSMAEFNLSREPELVESRERLQQLSEEGEQLTKSVEEKTKQLKDKMGDMSIETALALLQTAASEMEEESDSIAKKFLDSDIELDEYLEQFLSRRRIMHMRLVKAEKLAKILSRDPTLNNVPTYINAPPVNINTNYFPGIPNFNNPQPAPSNPVPYPIGPLNMPMPNYFQNHY